MVPIMGYYSSFTFNTVKWFRKSKKECLLTTITKKCFVASLAVVVKKDLSSQTPATYEGTCQMVRTKCFPALDILPRRDFHRRIQHSVNTGHQLHPSFFPLFFHQLSFSDSEEIAKAHDIKTHGFITLFPVFTMDLSGIILLATGISLLLFSFSFIVIFLQRDV